MENWKAIAGFDSLYEVSDMGRVRRIDSGNILTPYLRGGYPAVSIRNGKHGRMLKSIHLLVLEAFVGPRPPKHQGAHLDGDRRNASLSNLAWATQAENEAHKRQHGTARLGERSHLAKLTDEQADIIREIAGVGIAQVKIARLLSIGETSISRIVSRRTFS